MKLGITGHRPQKLGYEFNMKGPFSDFARKKINEQFNILKPKEFICGLALGIDMIGAIEALRAGINLIAAVPCLNQEKQWKSEELKDIYHEILKKAWLVKIVSQQEYFVGCMQIRNEWMIDYLNEPEDKLLGFHNGTTGGTFNCIKYAREKLPEENIIIINPFDYNK